tara:strand:- start:771 stop:1610 length:840 start_codon:yes stop_codon:yes gene_type:complete
MNLKFFKKYFHDELINLYSTEELNSLFFVLINYYLEISKIKYIQNPQKQINKSKIKKLFSKIKLLKENMPIQYVIGEVVHKKLKFYLNKNVLIPRPETEELCNWVISSKNKINRILDIGTGSGFIAIILKKFINDCEVEAWDNSREALKVAKKNAKNNNVKINFKHRDILDNDIPSSRFDVIVSNPPYVDYSEKNQINSRVKDFEPHDAIFVNHDDNMIFYKKIIEKSKRLLNQNGVLYFESHSSRINILENMLKINNFKRIIIKEDLLGKKRMVSAQK